MGRLVVTIIGGGAFAPRLCEALARGVDLPEVQLRLWARREERVQILAEHGARRIAAVRPGWTLRAASSLEDALAASAIVALLVRVGGLRARAWDETFPCRFGLVGDEGLGPGGIANAWRTLPELRRIAQAIQRVAPGARVINLMAPLGITTRLLLEQGLDAFGLCELPLLTIEGWLAATGHSSAEATWRYGGLNHLGWFWDVRAGGEDVLRRLAAGSSAIFGAAPIDRPTLERYHAAPLRYFYEVVDPEAGRRLGLERPPGRARRLIELADALFRRFSETPGAAAPEEEARPTPWLDRAFAPVVSSLLGGPPHEGFVNLRNGTLLPELPPELVVEVAATFSTSGARPVAPGRLPGPVADFLRAMGRSETLTFRAADRQDPGLLADAIQALPLRIREAEVQALAALAQRREGA
jgi:6-phospho-beta-glucosidase